VSTGDRSHDVVHMGRAGLDLYSNDIGVPFTEITSFSLYLGGSPANTCVGTRRLGLRVVMLTAVGDDLPGDYVVAFLEREGIDTRWIGRKRGFRTGAAMLALEPPDRFPLVYYRDRAADWQLDFDDVAAAPISDSRILQIAGTNLARDPSRAATTVAAEVAHQAGTLVVLDLDFRADQWPDARSFGLAMRTLLPLVDVVIGTEDELKAAVARDREWVRVIASQVTEASVAGDVPDAVRALASLGPELIVSKQGSRGATLHRRAGDGSMKSAHAPGFPANVVNTLGAGDAFAAGFIFGLLQGWDDEGAARFANGCGALVASRHACSAAMPYRGEVEALLSRHGVWEPGQA
jgi:5-dehydro-2-deoxygluconokinase